MTAIFKREFKAYFSSAIAYVFLTIMLLFGGYFFTVLNILNGWASMEGYFGNITIVLLFIVPLLTMRMLADERRNKTDQLLITSPVSIAGIVLGKYFASVALFLVSMLLMLVYAAIVLIFGTTSVGTLITLYIGFALLGATLLSVGLFMSSLTESQIISAICSFGALLFIWLIDGISSSIPIKWIADLLGWFSIMSRFSALTAGILDITSILYFVSFSAVFLFLTVMVIEKRRWS